MIRQEVIKQYIASLKEDGELDYIFPLLLQRMGFRILSTPRQSKGQPQYGRDVVAAKKVKGVNTLYLFELKGFRAKDITDRSLNEKDGLIESLRASKNTKYRDSSIPELASYKRQFVYVHNGYAESNALLTLNDFVAEEFPEKNFERWDLEKLTELFSQYLFDETLLADEENYCLFKKVLVLLDAEGNDFSDMASLINLQIGKMEAAKKDNQRAQLNFFATMRLIASMVYFYSKEADNLLPAKFCIDTIVIKTWAWILRNKLEKRTTILKHFSSLVILQMQIYEEYLNKVLVIAGLDKSIYSFESSDIERVFYPLRCYDFLGDLIYYFTVTEAYAVIDKNEVNRRLGVLKTIIRKNNACTMPLLDNHSIVIQMACLYLFTHQQGKDDMKCLGDYVVDTVINLSKRWQKQQMWPEMSGNKLALCRSLYTKDEDYKCESSLLLMIIFELIALLNIPLLYTTFKKVVEDSKVNLQIAFPNHEEYDIEQKLFEHRLDEELPVQTNIALPAAIEEFQNNFKKKYKSISYRTDASGYGFLRILAHKYYETDLFPDYLSRDFCVD